MRILFSGIAFKIYLQHDLPTSVNNRVISPFCEGLIFTKINPPKKFKIYRIESASCQAIRLGFLGAFVLANLISHTVKPVLSSHPRKDPKICFKTNNPLLQVKSSADCSHSAILLTCTKLPPVFKTFVLSIFEWPLKTGFTVHLFDPWAWITINKLMHCFYICLFEGHMHSC